MSHDWQRTHDMPDFTGQTVDESSGRLLWVLVALIALGLLILVSAFSYGPTSVVHPGGAGAAPALAVLPERAAQPDRIDKPWSTAC